MGAAWAINGLGQPIAPMGRFFGGVDCGFGFFRGGFGFVVVKLVAGILGLVIANVMEE